MKGYVAACKQKKQVNMMVKYVSFNKTIRAVFVAFSAETRKKNLRLKFKIASLRAHMYLKKMIRLIYGPSTMQERD